MKEQKHFIQIWIESEDDLPEDDGYYTIHRNDTDEWKTDYIYFKKIDKLYWLERIDWYLISTKQPKGLTDAEEKLFILDLLKLNKFIKIDDKKYYPEKSVINIIKQLLKTET